MKMLPVRSLVVFLFAMLFGQIAFAQYVWVDEKGVKQFSDQPPPPSVPKSKILRFPGQSMQSNDSGDSDDNQATQSKPPESLADKEMAYKKRREDQLAKDKKDDEAAKAAAAKSENCARAQQYRQSLSSGQRIIQTDANGQRSYMTDDQRTQALSNTDQALSGCN